MPKEDAVDRKWFLVDAQDQVLAVVATRVATTLRGKHRWYSRIIWTSVITSS
jgi:ribosomal protein L13